LPAPQVLRNAVDQRPLDVENHAVKPHASAPFLPHWNARGEQEFHRTVIIRNGDGKKLASKLKTALDETRLPFLGGQVLLGFQFQAFFQDGFPALSASARFLSLGGLALMVVSMALLSPL
jgi:hypothetical protein